MGVEYQKNCVEKAIVLNQQCVDEGLGKHCLAVVMTALTGSEKYNIHWIREINQEKGFPSNSRAALGKSGFKEAVIIGPGENLPLREFRELVEKPKSVLRHGIPNEPELVNQRIEGLLICYQPKVKRSVAIGETNKLVGHVSLIVPTDRLSTELRNDLKNDNRFLVIDAGFKEGYDTQTAEELWTGLQRIPPNLTSDISILVKQK